MNCANFNLTWLETLTCEVEVERVRHVPTLLGLFFFNLNFVLKKKEIRFQFLINEGSREIIYLV